MQKYLVVFLAFALFSPNGMSQSTSNEEIIKAYFEGWEKKDWNQVAAQLADGFTFTSPAPDDHISMTKFYEKCWEQASHIRKFEFVRMYGSGNETLSLVHVLTDTGSTIRNIEYFTFTNGKIKSIEVFFGGSGQGFPTNEK